MKKILFVIHDLGEGGAEKVLVNLVNHMDPAKFDITVMALFGGGVNEPFLNPDIRLIRCHKKTIRGNSRLMKLFSPEQLFRFYIKDRYDIIVSYLEGPTARIVSGCTDPNTCLISWIHATLNADHYTHSFRSKEEATACYRRFHRTICVSRAVQKTFTALFPEVSPVRVLYNTNDTARILSGMQQSADLPGTDAQYHLIGVGKITPTKGFDRLARIHKRLLDDGFRIHTSVLGIGPQRSAIEQYLRDQNIADSFTFLGYQTNPYPYIANADLFVCASYAEGFSTAATEALIVGTPVVTTLVSGMEEMLGANSEFGLITENSEDALYEGIKKLLSDTQLLSHYKEKAVQRGVAFHTKQTVHAVEQMLLDIS